MDTSTRKTSRDFRYGNQYRNYKMETLQVEGLNDPNPVIALWFANHDLTLPGKMADAVATVTHEDVLEVLKSRVTKKGGGSIVALETENAKLMAELALLRAEK